MLYCRHCQLIPVKQIFVCVSILALSVMDRKFKSRSGQTKYNRIGICCFSSKHAALWRKSKGWLARNQDNVSKWSDMSSR